MPLSVDDSRYSSHSIIPRLLASPLPLASASLLVINLHPGRGSGPRQRKNLVLLLACGISQVFTVFAELMIVRLSVKHYLLFYWKKLQNS